MYAYMYVCNETYGNDQKGLLETYLLLLFKIYVDTNVAKDCLLLFF